MYWKSKFVFPPNVNRGQAIKWAIIGTIWSKLLKNGPYLKSLDLSCHQFFQQNNPRIQDQPLHPKPSHELDFPKFRYFHSRPKTNIWALMCFDGPEGSIKSHEVEGPLKHMRFLGPSKHMRFLEGRNTSGSIKTHEVFGSIKTHEVLRGE